MKYLEEKGISCAWWLYDPQWWPQMIKSWDNQELTDNGKFFKDAADGVVGN
jgi:hypothetical protein